jgi:hypothetical protein
MYKSVKTQVESSLTDLYTCSSSPSSVALTTVIHEYSEWYAEVGTGYETTREGAAQRSEDRFLRPSIFFLCLQCWALAFTPQTSSSGNSRFKLICIRGRSLRQRNKRSLGRSQSRLGLRKLHLGWHHHGLYHPPPKHFCSLHRCFTSLHPPVHHQPGSDFELSTALHVWREHPETFCGVGLLCSLTCETLEDYTCKERHQFCSSLWFFQTREGRIS